MICGLLGLWCQVDAFYYPDRNDLTVHQEFLDVGSIQDCRDIVYEAAAANGDPDMSRGDYECGVGPRSAEFGEGLRVYRETVK